MEEFRIANLVGTDPTFMDSLQVIRKLAGCDVTAVIQGETGTGKELAARAIHYYCARRDGPFIPVNCGALPNDLVENELFGHVRGAFTDARDSRSGLVASAEGGTFFLDEIECLSSRGQVALLRFLQDGVYRPLGGDRLLTANARIIAASNTNLADLVRQGVFRRDLLYRLAVVTVTMPPLRSRPGDVALLAAHFVRRFAREYKQSEKALDPESLAALLDYDWPGNVRELENVIYRELLLAEGDTVRIRDVSIAQATEPPAAEPGKSLPIQLGFRRAKAHAIAEFERDFLARALAVSGGNVSSAARLVGKERRSFRRLLTKHGLRNGLCRLPS